MDPKIEPNLTLQSDVDGLDVGQEKFIRIYFQQGLSSLWGGILMV